MKVFLHIGTHKTGTTSIQRFASKNRELLAAHAIHWPTVLLDDHPYQHSGLADLVMQGDNDAVAGFVQAAMEEARAAQARALLLSGETFCHLPPQKVEAFAACLPEGTDLHVIVYFRNIYGYAISSIQQQLKVHNSDRDLHRLVESKRKSLNYSAIVAAWENVAPGERLDVRCYDTERDNLLPAFFERFGLPADAVLPLVPTDAKLSNMSLDTSTELLLAAIGYSPSVRIYGQTRDLYSAAFDGVDFVAPAAGMIAKAICDVCAPDLSHPRLAPHRAVLSAVPDRQKHSEEKDLIQYLDRFSQFAGALSEAGQEVLKPREKQRLLDRLRPKRK